ncbi:MAG: phosphoribosylglycinamide synthetase, partial [Actinobacteria bacterium]|nr:phosphoribosylglycinamide synthetase [Actinomycetota bacterium]
MKRSQVLFLDTRQLALERDAKIVAARSLGLGVIVAVPEPGAYTDWLVDEVLIVPLHDPPAAEALILDGLAARHVDPVAVVAWSDGEAELAARLGVRLGLRALCPAAAINVGNKIQTRRCLQRVPFGNPRFAVVRTEPEFLEALTAVGIPSVLRAADARDGRGPLRITDPQTALATFRRFRDAYHPRDQPTGPARSDEVLLEEVLLGSVHSVVGIVRDSRFHVLAVADKRYDV